MDKEVSSIIAMVRRPVGWRIVPTIPSDLTSPDFLQSMAYGFVQPTVFWAIVTPIEMRERRVEELKEIKKVGTAFIIWMTDNVDRYPGAKFDLEKSIGPYFKEKELLKRFDPTNARPWKYNATLSGKRDYDIEDPHPTVLLYEDGPGWDKNQLIVTADGAAFLADPEKL